LGWLGMKKMGQRGAGQRGGGLNKFRGGAV